MLTIAYGKENGNTPAILIMAFIWQDRGAIMRIAGNTRFFLKTYLI